MSIAQLQAVEFFRPRTIDDVCATMGRLHREGFKVWAIAGCTDWMVERHAEPMVEPPPKWAAVDVHNLPELRGIELHGEVLRVGSAEPFLQIRRHPAVLEHLPLLAEMASEVGAEQIQARGTLGGNLASGSPAADGVAALFALDAMVILRSERGERSVPITSFCTGYRSSVRTPDELIVRFDVSLPAKRARQFWRKVGTRKAQSISKVAIASVAETGNDGRFCRAGFGIASVAEVVLPLQSVRDLVLGKTPAELDLEAIAQAVDGDIRPIDDLRSTATYRRHVSRTLVRGFLENFRHE